MGSKRHLYIRMVRTRPRRKGQEPGPWEPFFPTILHRYESDDQALEQEAYGIRVWNQRQAREDHALFRVPAAALELVYPVAVTDKPRKRRRRKR